MSDNLTAWLREQRLARGWSIAEMGRRLQQAARTIGDHTVPSTAILASYVRRWEVGKIGLTERYRLHYCTALGIPAAQFGPQQSQEHALPSSGVTVADCDAGNRSDPEDDSWKRLSRIPSFSGYSIEPMRSTVTARPSDQSGEWDLVMSAAHESSHHVGASESASIGTNTLEQVGEDILRAARAYVYASPAPLLAELLRIRNRTYWLLDRTRNPAQQHDLYLVAGQACGLLASASFDLGYPHPAAQQARAARAYGEIIGSRELSAWADGMLACIEFWAGRPHQALLLAERGLTTAPDGTCSVRLWCILARAAAAQGDERRAVDAIVASKRVRDGCAALTELHDSIRGEFSFNLARQAFCNGSTYLKLARPADALTECEQAVRLYAQTAAEERWFGAEAGARADLAAAHLLHGDLASAREAISEVLTLHPERRIEGVVQRLRALHDVLTGSCPDAEAQTLAEEIEQFTATPVVKVLPASRS